MENGLDKKAYLAIALSIAIWMGWQKFYLEPIQQQQQLAEQRRQELLAAQQVAQKPVIGAATGAETVGMKSISAGTANQIAVKSGVLQNGSSKISVSNGPFAVAGWEIQAISPDRPDEKFSLEEITGFSPQLGVHFSDFPDLNKAVKQAWSSFEVKDNAAHSQLQSPGLKATRTLTLEPSGNGALIHYSFHFDKEVPKSVFLDLYGSPKRATDKEGSIFGQAPDKVMVTYRDLSGRKSVIGASLKEDQESAASLRWMGLDTRYFVMAVVPERSTDTDLGAQVAHDDLGSPAIRGSIVFPTGGKPDVDFSAKVYFGPKDMAALTKVDPLLSDAINFGWTSFIAIPLLGALKWLYANLPGPVKNYGIAIILLTFLIKMMLFPLMYKSMTSMAKMSKLQPQLNALREKYKDDKEKLNVEMMNFMKANGYNPVGGCLPILLQMPIFFALYRVLFDSMELYHAPFGAWIHDLSSPDPFFVTPVLLMGLMYLQQKLSPNTAADPAQQKMMQIMPVMFGAFMFMLPSGLTIYMVVNSAVSISQQYFLNRRLGITRASRAAVTS
ncbi:MAG: membrane protein insertase YidC [Bdellovibrionota bacterium]